METILDPETRSESSSEENVKAASAPIVPIESDKPKVKVQISAPSYLHSLDQNEAPPFKKSVKEPRPHLLLGTIMTEDNAISMIAAVGASEIIGLKNYIGDFLVTKKVVHNYSLSEKSFLINFIIETIDYAAQRDFSAKKLAGLLTLYLSTHIYFKWYYWMPPTNIWNYFKEIMIRHTIEDSPDGEELFEPDECYDILTHFHCAYMSNLPLVHLLTFGAYRLKFVWPFKLK